MTYPCEICLVIVVECVQILRERITSIGIDSVHDWRSRYAETERERCVRGGVKVLGRWRRISRDLYSRRRTGKASDLGEAEGGLA